MSNETIGGLKRLSKQIGGDDRDDVLIEGGTAENIAINSYNMPPAGEAEQTDQIPIVRNGQGYLLDVSELNPPLPLPDVINTDGNYTLTDDVRGAILISNDSTPTNYFLPDGLPAGYTVRSYQGGTGQISYVASGGATIIDGQLRSLGSYDNGYWVDIQNLGNDAWIVIGNTTPGVLEWSIVGNTYVQEADAATYVILRPDSTASHDEGVTLTVTGIDFATSG